MKKTWPVIILSGMIVILFFSGFSFKTRIKKGETKKEGSKILGSWQSKGAAKSPSKMTFLPTGRFEADLDGDGAKDLEGEYSASSNRFTLINKEGAIAPDCHSAGVYRYTVFRKELRLTQLSDLCLSRAKAFETAWKRAETMKNPGTGPAPAKA